MTSSQSMGQGVPFERIRRITGYLVGTTDRFNNAKRAEEKDRVKHCSLASPVRERRQEKQERHPGRRPGPRRGE